MNDFGKWMYYENGKAITGTKTIDGTTYEFNAYGEIPDTPKKLTYGTYTVKKDDSWWKISSEQKCNMFELARVNGKTIFSIIYTGDVLKVPQQ